LVRAMVSTAYDEMKAKGYPGATLTLLDSVGGVVLDFDPTKAAHAAAATAGAARNLVAENVDVARRAVAGKSGYDEERARDGREAQATGFAHLHGAMGYPGMNWSLIVRAPERELLAVTGIGAAERAMTGVFVLTLVLVPAVGLV